MVEENRDIDESLADYLGKAVILVVELQLNADAGWTGQLDFLRDLPASAEGVVGEVGDFVDLGANAQF